MVVLKRLLELTIQANSTLKHHLFAKCLKNVLKHSIAQDNAVGGFFHGFAQDGVLPNIQAVLLPKQTEQEAQKAKA